VTRLAEHRAHAEELLERGSKEASEAVLGMAAVTIARAQVHATLALAAAIDTQTRLAHGDH
jgi:hypothetical protein